MRPNGIALADFLSQVFDPARSAWEKTRNASYSSGAKRFTALALVEAYRWISLAVQARVFPADLALERKHSDAVSVIDANEFIRSENLLEEAVVNETENSLRSFSFPTSFEEQHRDEFRGVPESSTIFSLWLAECTSFLRSPSASAFVLSFNEKTEQSWLTALNELDADRFDPSPRDDRPSLFEGYLECLQHLNRMADLFSVSGTEDEKYEAIAIMRVAAVSVHGWRLDLQNAYYRNRFTQATAKVEGRLLSEALQFGINLERNGFVHEVDNVVTRYLGETGYLRYAVAAY